MDTLPLISPATIDSQWLHEDTLRSTLSRPQKDHILGGDELSHCTLPGEINPEELSTVLKPLRLPDRASRSQTADRPGQTRQAGTGGTERQTDRPDKR